MEQVVQHLSGLVESFLVSKRVSGCTEPTLDAYRMWLDRFAQSTGGALTPLTVRQFFAALQEQHLHQEMQDLTGPSPARTPQLRWAAS